MNKEHKERCKGFSTKRSRRFPWCHRKKQSLFLSVFICRSGLVWVVTFMVQICVNAYVTFLYSGFSVFRFFRILALDVFRILVIFVLGIVSNPYMLYLNHLVSLGSTSACMHLFCTVRVFSQTVRFLMMYASFVYPMSFTFVT